MSKEYYLNDKAWAYCTNGTLPGKMKVVNPSRTVKNNKLILLTIEDRFTPFSCKFMILLMAAVAAFVAALSFVAAVIIGLILGIGLCALATYASRWIAFHPRVIVEGKHALTTKSRINCAMGGEVKPTFDGWHALAHSSLNLGQAVLEAFAINRGLQFLKPMFAQHGLKMGLGLFGANFAFNSLVDFFVTKNATRAVNNAIDQNLWGRNPENDQFNFTDTSKDLANYSSDNNGEATGKMNEIRTSESSTESDRQANTERVRQEHIDQSDRQANRDYNREVQRENTKINEDQRQASRDYRDLYKEQARQAGERGRGVHREATRQGRQSAARDAVLRKEQARQQAEARRQAAMQDGRTRANQSAADYEQRNPARSTLAKQLFKSAMGGVLLGVVTDVAFKQGHNAIDALFDSTAEQAKKAGINAVAVEQ